MNLNLLRHLLNNTQAVFILLGFLSFNVYGSTIAAGNNLTIRAAGDGTKGADGFATDGDVNVIGSNLSGKNVSVTGARDVNFASALNTSTENSTNKSSSANVGVSLGVSASGSFGLSVFANVAAGRGRATGNGTTHTETQVTATDNLTVNAGRDLNMTGAQARGESIDVDVGRNLTITSEQDTNDYKSKQTNASAGVSVPIIGAGAVSANVGVNQQKVNSTYTSVVEQSGLFAGNGGFDVNVKGHTQLNGGAIASTAPSEFNTLTTGSLGYTDIENHAEYRATSSGVNVGTGSLLSNALKNATSALPMSGNQSGSDSSTTRSVISPATVVIAGQAATDAQLAGLSRDAASANDSLKPIFDLQKVQDDMALGQVVGEIGTQATGIVRTAMERDAYVARDQAMADAESKLTLEQLVIYNDPKQTPDKAAYLQNLNRPKTEDVLASSPFYNSLYQNAKTDADKAAVIDQMERGGLFGSVAQAQQNYLDAQNQYGVGSTFGRAAQAITGLASGIAGGNVGQGLSAAAQPFLANAVGTYFDNQAEVAKARGESTDGIEAARLLAHAAVGAAVAYASGNDAASGAVGGVAGEAIAQIVRNQMYDGKSSEQLTEQEKENVRAIATLASSLVGGAAGGSFEDAAIAANAGYNAAVNNDLNAKESRQAQKEIASACMTGSTFNADGDCINTISKWQKISASNMGRPASAEVWALFADEAQKAFDPVRRSCKGDTQCLQIVELMQLNATVSAFPYVDAGYYDFTAGISLAERARVDKIAVDSVNGNWGQLAIRAGLDALEIANIKTVPIFNGINKFAMVRELKQLGVKVSPEKLVAMRKLPDGKIIFLEEGTSKIVNGVEQGAGLAHIMKHADEFKDKNIPASDIAKIVVDAVNRGKIVGKSGSAPVFEVIYNGVAKYIAVGVGSNGYIVRANPVSTWKALP